MITSGDDYTCAHLVGRVNEAGPNYVRSDPVQSGSAPVQSVIEGSKSRNARYFF